VYHGRVLRPHAFHTPKSKEAAMSPSMTLPRLALAALAATAIAAPAAQAKPIDPTGPAPAVIVPQDRHHPRVPATPEWPVDSHVLGRSQAQLAGADGDEGGTDVPAVLVIIGGTLVAGGGMAAVAATRRRPRPAH
jgi:hypothetical protein